MEYHLPIKTMIASSLFVILALSFTYYYHYFPLHKQISSCGISYTAYITGYILAKHGLADSKFKTYKSYFLYQGSKFIHQLYWRENKTRREDYVLLRYQIIDFLLHDFICNEGIHDVIEIAAGFSPRGMNFSKIYGQQIRYIETDLPDIVKEKYKLVNENLNEFYVLRRINSLLSSGNESISSLFSDECSTTSKPIAIISEGLVNYFDKVTVQDIWTRIADNLNKCAQGGVYISDIAILPSEVDKETEKMLNSSFKVSKYFLGVNPGFPFATPQDVQEALLSCNFHEVTIYSPSQFHHQIDGTSGEAGQYLHVIVARVRGREGSKEIKQNIEL